VKLDLAGIDILYHERMFAEFIQATSLKIYFDAVKLLMNKHDKGKQLILRARNFLITDGSTLYVTFCVPPECYIKAI
jgi:hypothetical protein